MTEEVKKPEAKTDEQLWDQTGKDAAATIAADKIAEPVKPEVKVEAKADAGTNADLPEPTRKLIEGLDAKWNDRFTKVNQQLATAHGTIGNLKQRLDASQVELTKIAPTIEAVETEKKKAQQAAADAKAAKRKALRGRLADLPDVLELMDEVLPADAEPAKEAKPEPKTEVKPEPKADAQPAGLSADKEALLIAQRELSDRHPGWMKTINSPEFTAWSGAQPADVQALRKSDSIDDADKMLTLYAKHKTDAAQVAKVEQERQERLRRGGGPQGRGSSAAKVDTSKDALWDQTGRDFAKAQAG